jgi:hypothetical protein
LDLGTSLELGAWDLELPGGVIPSKTAKNPERYRKTLSTKEFLDSGIGQKQNTNYSSENREHSILLGLRTVTSKDFHHSSRFFGIFGGIRVT